DRHRADASALEIVAGFLGVGMSQRLLVEERRLLHELAKLGSPLAGAIAGQTRLELDPGPRREGLERLGELEILRLHDKAEDVAVCAAAKAMVVTLIRKDDERRRLLGMERAQPFVRPSGLLQRDPLANDVDDVETGLDLGDG